MSAAVGIQDFLSWPVKEQLAVQISVQCAPVITGIKAGNTLVIPTKWTAELEYHFKDTDICYQVMYSDGQKDFILVYRADILSYYLQRPEIRRFMNRFGYQGCSLNRAVERLEQRFRRYHEKEAEFPHELGVFLHYPLADIEGFITCKGKNSLLTGYWKVYGSVSYARYMFRLYDQARDRVLAAVLNGESFAEIIYLNVTVQKQAEI